jgi:LmbE family N-acetylglucosaminyl deacetylase
MIMSTKIKSVAVIVAHPDDETLWAGGTILERPAWKWFIVSLCRRSDKKRAPRFYKALTVLGSEGIMGDLDDGPEQKPLDEKEVEAAVLALLPVRHFDLIITHNPSGEYTKHIRHEETNNAVVKLWQAGKISAGEILTFAYQDGGKKYYPRPVENASIYFVLTEQIWLRKYRIITETYGFKNKSWEALTTPRAESFWRSKNLSHAQGPLDQGVLE